MRITAKWLAALTSSSLLASCSSPGSSKPITYTIGGTLSGLAGGGLVLRNGGADDLPLAGNGSFTFSTPVAGGASYAVTVASQPSSPTQICTVANGSGTVGTSNVTTVHVSCVTVSHTVGGAVAGLEGTGLVLQDNAGDDLAVSANGPFAFATPVANGGAYAVTVLTQPTVPRQTCTVTNGAGTVGVADVTTVAVTCVTNGYLVGGTVTGLEGSGMILRNDGGDDLVVSGNGTFHFSTAVASGRGYRVTIQRQPSMPTQACTVTNGAGTVEGANVTSVAIECPPAMVLQEWRAPVTWGGATSFWPDGEPNMVEHLVFTPAVDETSAIAWTAPDGAPRTNNALPGVGSVGVTRYGAGPFDDPATGARFVAASGDDILDIQGDFLVCAVVKPDWNPDSASPGLDRIVMAKGVRGAAGWALMQSDKSFAFVYRSSSGPKEAFTETDFAMPLAAANPPSTQGPLNPSYVVLCGGRDVAGGNISVVANGWASSQTAAVPAGDAMVTAIEHASVGGYAANDTLHGFGGRVYETAVWGIPATRANIEAKMAPILGLFMADGATPASYLRDREGYYPGVGGSSPYHTAWKHQPRIDPGGKGFLFGLQATNSVPYPEALQLWTRTPGSGPGAPVVTGNDTYPPGDADIQNATRILLPAGAKLSILLPSFGNPGFLHGQIWVRGVGSSPAGTLTIASDITGTTPVTAMGSQAVPLGSSSTWTNIQLTELTAAPALGRNTLFLRNDGATPIEFHAWGIVLTQLGRDLAGSNTSVVPKLGFDPGPTIYSSLATSAATPREVLTFQAIRPSTAAYGFCIGAEGQPATNMTWQGPFLDQRTLVEWQAGDASGDRAKIMVMGSPGGNALRFLAQVEATTATIEVNPLPVSLATNTAARIKGCVTANGTMTLLVNDVSVGSATLGVAPPDLSGGSVSVGSDHSGTEPFQGYVRRAVACRYMAPLADCLAGGAQ